MLAIQLSKQNALDGNPKTIKQINVTGNLSGNNNRIMFFVIGEVKKLL